MSTKLNHIAIVVHDIDEALKVYSETLGLPLQKVNEEPAEAVKVAYMPTATGEVELIQPITDDSGVAKFLAKKGEGCTTSASKSTTLMRVLANWPPPVWKFWAKFAPINAAINIFSSTRNHHTAYCSNFMRKASRT